MTGGRSARSAAAEMFLQPVQECGLSLLQLEPRFVNCEKADLVNLGKRLEFPRADRPFRAESVAHVLVSFGHIAFTRPGMHDFATLLRDCAEFHERSFRNETNLFPKFALRREQQILIVGIRLAFGNGPVTIIFSREERPSRMRQKNFDRAIAEPVEEQARGDSGTSLFPHGVRVQSPRIQNGVAVAL